MYIDKIGGSQTPAGRSYAAAVAGATKTAAETAQNSDVLQSGREVVVDTVAATTERSSAAAASAQEAIENNRAIQSGREVVVAAAGLSSATAATAQNVVNAAKPYAAVVAARGRVVAGETTPSAAVIHAAETARNSRSGRKAVVAAGKLPLAAAVSAQRTIKKSRAIQSGREVVGAAAELSSAAAATALNVVNGAKPIALNRSKAAVVAGRGRVVAGAAKTAQIKRNVVVKAAKLPFAAAQRTIKDSTLLANGGRIVGVGTQLAIAEKKHFTDVGSKVVSASRTAVRKDPFLTASLAAAQAVLNEANRVRQAGLNKANVFTHGTRKVVAEQLSNMSNRLYDSN